MIIYHKGDLFNAPKGSILAHACNCRGRWGSGIAAIFARQFQMPYRAYQADCQRFGDQLLGSSKIYTGREYKIAALFTSRGFGSEVDSPEQILKATETAVWELKQQAAELGLEVHMPKINSGLFRVPWDMTAALINDTSFNVWEL